MRLPPAKRGPAVLIIHSWWGLTKSFTAFGDALAKQGFVVGLADLFDGKTASDPAEAKRLRAAPRREPMYKTLLRNIEKDKLGLALKGSSEAVRDLFFTNMSERAGKILREEMEVMGPVRLSDVDEAQMLIVSVAKELSASGEIVIASSKDDDELVYYSLDRLMIERCKLDYGIKAIAEFR